MDTFKLSSDAPVPEAYIIDELEKLRREQYEEQRPQLELPLPPPAPPKPVSNETGGTVIVLQF